MSCPGKKRGGSEAYRNCRWRIIRPFLSPVSDQPDVRLNKQIGIKFLPEIRYKTSIQKYYSWAIPIMYIYSNPVLLPSGSGSLTTGLLLRIRISDKVGSGSTLYKCGSDTLLVMTYLRVSSIIYFPIFLEYVQVQSYLHSHVRSIE